MALANLNSQTLAQVIARAGADSQQVAWMVNIHKTSRGHSPIAKWFGGTGGGRPIMEVMDTRRLAGQEIVATVKAGLGQRGVRGEGARMENSEKPKSRTYRAKIGMGFHSVSQTRVANNMTLIGSDFDKSSSADLGEWAAFRKQHDVEAEMFARRHERNTMRPNNKASLNDLTSADTFGIGSIIDIRDTMSSINATPLALSKKADGEIVSKYYIQGHNYAFGALNRNSTWMSIRANAENRGPGNSLFAGGKPMWEGSIINEWDIKLNDFDATQGARCMPIAVLGVTIDEHPNASTADDLTGGIPSNSYKYIYGGGSNAAASNTRVDYFQNFINASYEGFEGEKIAAATDEAYVAIKSMSGANKGKIRLFAYTANDGNKLTISRALDTANSGDGTDLRYNALSASGSPATWNTGAWTTDYLTDSDMPVGSMIYQCNIKGQCVCYVYGIGDRMMLCGYGSVDGKVAMGTRIPQEQDFKKDVGIGIELVWGCRATQDTNDMVNGYVIYECAHNPAGFPQIT